jgi:hypothetical protein
MLPSNIFVPCERPPALVDGDHIMLHETSKQQRATHRRGAARLRECHACARRISFRQFVVRVG